MSQHRPVTPDPGPLVDKHRWLRPILCLSARVHYGQLLIVSCLVLLGVWIAALVLRPVVSAAPIYSLGTVRTGLQFHPQAWVGRTVHVRAVVQDIEPYFPSASNSVREMCVLLMSTSGSRNVLPGNHGVVLWTDPRRMPSHPLNTLLLYLQTLPGLGALIHVHDRHLLLNRPAVFVLTLLPRRPCPVGACMSNPDAMLDDVLG